MKLKIENAILVKFDYDMNKVLVLDIKKQTRRLAFWSLKTNEKCSPDYKLVQNNEELTSYCHVNKLLLLGSSRGNSYLFDTEKGNVLYKPTK
jgi:hypothetical protein